MKICFIGGCGHAGEAYRRWVGKPQAEICGYAPWSVHERGIGIAAQVPQFPNAEEMLDTVRPDIAVVAPVFGLAAKAVLACAARGIDVLCEKPVATTLQDLEMVKRAVRESGIRFCAMHEMRFFPTFFESARIVRAGAVGEVKLICAQKSYKFGSHRPDWYQDRALYGGTVPWVGIHAMDWIYHFTGKRFLSVRAQSDGACPERAALCQFTLEENIPVSLSLDYYRPRVADGHGDDRIRVVGTEGILEVCQGEILLLDGEGERAITPPPTRSLWERFIAGEEPIPAEEILYLTRVALLARKAADTGKEIQIEGGITV